MRLHVLALHETSFIPLRFRLFKVVYRPIKMRNYLALMSNFRCLLTVFLY